ncbi:P-loop containing nucleoside triphosphate hydrolase protein [Amanita muscaria]
MMHWLSKHPAWSEARNLTITTRTFGLNCRAVLVPGEQNDVQELASNKRRLAYIPSVSMSTVMWYKHHWMRTTRLEVEAQSYYRRREEQLQIRILSRSHDILNQLLLEAKKEYVAAKEDTISVFVSDSSNDWRHLANRPKRPLASIILDPGVKDELIADAKEFLQSRSWYAARGIPFRRGYLLYGAPGSGKTSLIHTLAGELDLDIYVISLSRSGLDDTSLTELVSSLPERCIALMEDVDAALTQSITRELDASQDGEKENKVPAGATDRPEKQAPSSSLGKVSLSGLLNALDGISAQEGRILFATTNKYSSLDPALCRPGRMDVHIEFTLASKFQARELYKAFYMPDSEEDQNEIMKKQSETRDVSNEEKPVDDIKDLIDLSAPSDSDKVDHSLQSNKGSHIIGYLQKQRAPTFPRKVLVTMADAFAEAIPERGVSMAALQGYLMMYKTRPSEAIRNANVWVERQTSDKKERESSGKASTDATENTKQQRS